MKTRRKTRRWFQLEPMEGRVSLSAIGRSLPHTAPAAFGPVACGSKPGGTGEGIVPLTCGTISIRYGQETNAGTASPFQKVREA